TGSVRHWPRMPEAQLASVLSKGQLGSASASDGSQRSRMPGLLARLFGVGRDEAQDAATAAASPPVKAAANARKPAAPESRPEKAGAGRRRTGGQKGCQGAVPARQPRQGGRSIRVRGG